MTGTEIQAMAAFHTEGDTIDNTSALKFINECMIMDLGADARVIDSEVITVTKNTFVALPTGILEIFEITKSGQTTPYFGNMYGNRYQGLFDLRNGHIRFPYDGIYTIWHYRVPAAITDLSNTPEVHSLFHYPMSLYVAYRYKFYDDEDSKDAKRLREEYGFYKADAISKLKKLGPSTMASRIIRARSW